MLKTIVSYISLSFFTFLFGSIGMILAPFSNRLAIIYAVRSWGRSCLWGCGIKLNVNGLENLPEEPSIIMYNHQSSFDILAFAAALPIEWKAIMKNEVLRMPFIGWVSKLGGHYFVARDGSSGDSKQVKKIVSEVKNGPSVILAPEGTRSEDGRLLPFKKGGFLIALLAGVPVVPMVIWGGKNIRPKGSYKIDSSKEIDVHIMKPIDVKTLPKGRKGREELEERVKTSMENIISKYIELEKT